MKGANAGWLGRFRLQFAKVLRQRDTPRAIAGGVAIGIFFGFSPFWGLKTILSLVAASLCRCNRMAAVLGVCLPDLLTPVLPALLRWQYDIGFVILQNPHRWPPHLDAESFSVSQFFQWDTFDRVGIPLLVGSLLIAVPAAVLAYVIVYFVTRRLQAKGSALN